MLIKIYLSCHRTNVLLLKLAPLFFQVRILVTHGIGFLPQCDVIVVMADGQITEVGSYTELIDNDGAFAQFLGTHQNVENEEEAPGNQLISSLIKL